MSVPQLVLPPETSNRRAGKKGKRPHVRVRNLPPPTVKVLLVVRPRDNYYHSHYCLPIGRLDPMMSEFMESMCAVLLESETRATERRYVYLFTHGAKRNMAVRWCRDRKMKVKKFETQLVYCTNDGARIINLNPET